MSDADRTQRSTQEPQLEGLALPRVGDVLAGKYRVQSVLGSGGMGVVLLAEHQQLGQAVAIKLMLPEGSADPQAVPRFLQEARAAARLRSEHVVKIFDVGTLETGSPYFVMEVLRGSDLGDVLLKRGQLEVVEAVDLLLQACDAIGEAHAMGIVHRDLKPANMFVLRRSDGTALLKVLDFGISKAMTADAGQAVNMTGTSRMMGSPLYMSPEQVRDARTVDRRADIWSLGVILQELVTGKPVFSGDTLPAVCASIVADPPAPILEERPDLPPEFAAIVTRCLEKDVGRRYATVEALVDALLPYSSRAGEGTHLVLPANRSSSPSSGEGTLRSPSGHLRLVSGTPRHKTPSIPHDAPTMQADAPDDLHGSHAPVASTRGGKTHVKPRRSSTPLIVALGALALVATIGATALRARSAAEPASSAAAPSTAAPAVTAEARGRASFTLLVDSLPSGAEVIDGEKVLGTTPMQLPVDNDAAKRAPLRLVVRRPGFEPYTVLQGPSEENVRVVATLAVVPPDAAAAPPPAGAKPARAASPGPAHQVAAPPTAVVAPAAPATAAPAPPAPSPGADIRLKR